MTTQKCPSPLSQAQLEKWREVVTTKRNEVVTEERITETLQMKLDARLRANAELRKKVDTENRAILSDQKNLNSRRRIIATLREDVTAEEERLADASLLADSV
ncbi:hypothetical protein TYRP_017321 [Tyrophagus putrescentiae]|nr:hypothetical protein TYRP_017321 [Tyrophagus putrescentiae]